MLWVVAMMMRFVALVSLPCCLALLFACSESVPAGRHHETDAGHTPLSGPDAETECAQAGNSDYVSEPCSTSLEGPCEPVYLDQQGQPFVASDTHTPSTIEDARCLLRALRDRTPGYFWFVTEHSPGLGLQLIAGTRRGYHVLPDGTAISSYDRWYDLMSEKSWRHVMPKPAAFFDACLGLPFGSELYECLVQWTDPDVPSTCPVCEAP